jgi:hypothetical protein
MKETIVWITDPKNLPDAESTVLVETVNDLDTGFYDDGVWRWAGSAELVHDPVLAWAEMPEGTRGGAADLPALGESGLRSEAREGAV